MARLIGPLVSVPAQNDATWTLRSANIADYIGKRARLVIYHPSGPAYNGDVQFDDFNIGGNFFDPETGANGFETNAAIDNSQLSSFTQPVVEQAYNSVNWQTILPEGSNHETSSGFMVRDSSGTPSGNTGNTTGYTGNYYFFAENSYGGSNNDVWLRSPEVTVSNGTFSFYSAQNGANCGAIYAFLEIQEESPEAGLTLTGSVAAGTISGTEYSSRTQNVVHAGEVVLPSSFTSPACLYEHGGAGTGTWLGVIQDPDNGNAWSLRFRSSDGASNVQHSNGNTVVINVPLADIPEFDDGIHTIAFEIKVTAPGRLRLWIDGREIMHGYTTGGGALEGTSFSGGDNGGWGTGVNSIAGVNNYDGSNAYQTDASWPTAVRSDLRYYLNQLAGGQAVYGTAVYGVATYGSLPFTVNVGTYEEELVGQVNTVASIVAEANVTPQSVQTTATADTDIIITADATHTLVSVSAAFAQGNVGVVGVAVHQVDGVQATGQNNTAVVTADANTLLSKVTGTGFVGTAITKASATAQPTGVFATGVADVSGEGFKVFSRVIVPVTVSAVGIATVNSVDVTADAVSGVSGSTAIVAVGDTTIVAKATTPVTGTTATTSVNDVVVTADSVLTSQSISATASVPDVTVTADAVTLPTGVLASATADTDIVITADSNHILVSVSSAFAQGQVGVIGIAVVESQAVNATGFTGVTVITADSNYTTNSVEGNVVVDTDSIVTADANTPVATDANVGDVGNVVVVAEANTLLTSVFGFGQMGGNVVVAEANTLTDSVDAIGDIGDSYTIIEGQGVDAPTIGVEATGEVYSVVVVAEANTTLESVQASVTADTDIIITADANHTLISVQGLMLNGGVGEVIAEAQTVVDSVEATGEVDSVGIVATANVTPEPAIGISEVGDNVVTADSNLLLDNITGTAITGDSEVIADAIMSVYGTEAVPYFSDNSVVVAKALQSVSGFALQIDQGTESVSTVVTVFYPDAFARDRVAYVMPRENTNNRTTIVPASESRSAIVPADSQSRVVKIAA